MFQQIAIIVFPIFAIVLAGYLYGRRHAPDMNAANKINIDIFIPALIFDVLSGKEFQLTEYSEMALVAALVVLGSGLLAWPVARFFGFQVKTFVPPMMFSNSGNMGLPLALFAFGDEALPAAVVLFIVENTLHFTVGFRMIDPKASLALLFRIPMIWATILGLLASIFKLPVPELIAVPINMVGQVAIPLMLFSLGVRLITIDFRDWKIGVIGALVCPITGLLLAWPLARLFGLEGQQFAMLMVFGALPPAVLNFMLAERYQQEPQQVASLVMLGNLASFLFIPLTLLYVFSLSAG